MNYRATVSSVIRWELNILAFSGPLLCHVNTLDEWNQAELENKCYNKNNNKKNEPNSEDYSVLIIF